MKVLYIVYKIFTVTIDLVEEMSFDIDNVRENMIFTFYGLIHVCSALLKLNYSVGSCVIS